MTHSGQTKRIVTHDYRSPRMSTIGHTRSSIVPEESAKVPWLTRGSSFPSAPSPFSERSSALDSFMEPLNACDLHDPYFLRGQYASGALDSSLELLDASRWANLERY